MDDHEDGGSFDDSGLSLGLDQGGLSLSFNMGGSGGGKHPHGVAVAAAICAMLPFALSMSFNDFDIVKLIAGTLGVALGTTGVLIGVLRTPRRWGTAALSSLAIVVGIAQVVLSGFLGMIISGVLDDSEEQARAALDARHMENVELTDRGRGDYAFEAERDGQFCQGSISVQRDLFESHTDVRHVCGGPMPLGRLEVKCARGEGQACAEAASQLRRQEPVDWTRATLLAQRACEHDAAAGCFHWGVALKRGGRGVPQDAEASVTAYGRGCELGNAPSCMNRGVALVNGQGAEREPTAGCDSWERACSLFPRFCGALGECFRDGQGRPHDGARARELFHQGCEEGSALSCTNEAAMYLREPHADRARAFALYTRACEGRDPVGCRMQASLQIDGPVGTRDPQTGAERLAQMCEGGDGIACLNAGMAFHEGAGVLERDRARAFTLFQKGCEANDGACCRNVAVYLRDRLGGQRGSREQVRTMLARACELGNHAACRGR